MAARPPAGNQTQADAMTTAVAVTLLEMSELRPWTAPIESMTRHPTRTVITDMPARWTFNWKPYRAYGKWYWLWHREHWSRIEQVLL
jgi:hypothetical protein